MENINLSEDKLKTLRGIIYNAPLALTVIEDNESIKYINSFLPYSIGIEFDTQKSEDYNLSNFQKIPDIIEINNDDLEQRYRIPNGINGMICLYNLLEQMKLNNIYDELGGIHLHVDMTNTFRFLNENKIRNFKEYVLIELDKWKYSGTYNPRDVRLNSRSAWLNFQSEFKTAEFRICEMTFDHTILIKRIIHICEIVSYINNIIYPSYKNHIEYKELDNEKIISYIKNINNDLKSKINNINEELSNFADQEEQNKIRKKLKKELLSIVQSRIVKMY